MCIDGVELEEGGYGEGESVRVEKNVETEDDRDRRSNWAGLGEEESGGLSICMLYHPTMSRARTLATTTVLSAATLFTSRARGTNTVVYLFGRRGAPRPVVLRALRHGGPFCFNHLVSPCTKVYPAEREGGRGARPPTFVAEASPPKVTNMEEAKQSTHK